MQNLDDKTITSADEKATIQSIRDEDDKTITSTDKQPKIERMGTMKKAQDRTNQPIQQQAKKTKLTKLQFHDIDCVTDIIDLRRHAKDASSDDDEEQIDFKTDVKKTLKEDWVEIRYAKNIKSLLKGNFGLHPDVTVGEEHYAQFLLRRNRIHREAIQKYIHETDGTRAEKEELFEKLKGKIL